METRAPTDEYLEAYILNFFGYGAWDFDLWFVGMEEGGVSSFPEFQRRLAVWIERGSRSLEEAIPYHRAFGKTEWFGPNARLQSTWKELIRIHLVANGQDSDTESVRRFQGIKFGMPDSGFSCIELFSLPSPGVSHWIYRGVADLPYLINRKVYSYYLYPKRAEALRARILRHRPANVVVYGKQYLPEWEGIAQNTFEESRLDDAFETTLGDTRVLLIPHPVAKGYSTDYWRSVGTFLGQA